MRRYELGCLKPRSQKSAYQYVRITLELYMSTFVYVLSFTIYRYIKIKIKKENAIKRSI